MEKPPYPNISIVLGSGFVFTFGRSQFVQVIVQQIERWTVNCYTWDMNSSAGLVIVFVQKKKVI